MPEFMQLIETMRAEEASIQRLFGSEGVQVRRHPRRDTPQYKRNLLEAMKLVRNVMEGVTPLYRLQEALSTSDFPTYFGDTLDRMVVQEYRAAPSDWRDFLKVSRVRDFRTVDRYKMSDGDQRLQQVAEGEAYPVGDRDESSYSFSVNKYGRRFRLLWEVMVNDDLEALRNFPSLMARAAKRTEDYFAASLYVNNTTLFSTTHSVNGTNYSNKDTAALSLTALEAAYNAMVAYPGDANSDGYIEPIFNAPVFLVVPPQLKITADKILRSDLNFINTTETNVLRGEMQVKVDPYMPIVDTTNGATSWYLFADPGNGHAAEVAFLRGYEEPGLFQKTSNQVRLGGGGPTDPMEGDFETDAVEFKVRHVVGGSHANAIGGWRFAYFSDGTA